MFPHQKSEVSQNMKIKQARESLRNCSRVSFRTPWGCRWPRAGSRWTRELPAQGGQRFFGLILVCGLAPFLAPYLPLLPCSNRRLPLPTFAPWHPLPSFCSSTFAPRLPLPSFCSVVPLLTSAPRLPLLDFRSPTSAPIFGPNFAPIFTPSIAPIVTPNFAPIITPRWAVTHPIINTPKPCLTKFIDNLCCKPRAIDSKYFYKEELGDPDWI